jgi:hypothetical protein
MATEVNAALPRPADRSAGGRAKVWMTAAPPRRSAATGILAVAATLLVVSAILHLDLWSSGYRAIPTIGWLFLAQGITTPIIALALLLTRWLAVVVMAFATMVGTLGGFILASTVGLFGFHDGFAAPFASATFVTEVTASVFLLVGAAVVVRGVANAEASSSLSHRVDEIFDSAPNSGAAVEEHWTGLSASDAMSVDECWSVRAAPTSSWPPNR